MARQSTAPPAWTLTLSYNAAHSAMRQGRLTAEQWDGYRAIWRYSVGRFSNAVGDLPSVRAINAAMDAGLDQYQPISFTEELEIETVNTPRDLIRLRAEIS